MKATPSVLYDRLIPDIVDWMSFLFSRPTLTQVHAPKIIGASEFALGEALKYAHIRDTFDPYFSVLGESLSCWLCLSAQYLALDPASPECTFNLQGLVYLFGAALGTEASNRVSESMGVGLEARADDVAAALVGTIVHAGLTDVGNRENPIADEWYDTLRLMYTMTRWPKMCLALHAHDVIYVVCRLMRRIARLEVMITYDLRESLCAMTPMTLSGLINLFYGPEAAMQALQARCFPSLLRMQASFAQTDPYIPREIVDDDVLLILSDIRSYTQVPSFIKVVGKSLRCIDRMMHAKTNALKVSGRIEAEYRKICEHFVYMTDVVLKIKTPLCAAQYNVCSVPLGARLF